MTEPETATDVNRRCGRCGAAVSRRFVRVFGMGDTVHGCLDCLPRNRLSNGEAARRDDADRERSLRAP